MNTKELIAQFGEGILNPVKPEDKESNVQMLIQELQKDLYNLSALRNGWANADNLVSTFKEVNSKYAAFVKKTKADLDPQLFEKSMPELGPIMKLAQYNKDVGIAKRMNTKSPNMRDYVEPNVSVTQAMLDLNTKLKGLCA